MSGSTEFLPPLYSEGDSVQRSISPNPFPCQIKVPRAIKAGGPAPKLFASQPHHAPTLVPAKYRAQAYSRTYTPEIDANTPGPACSAQMYSSCINSLMATNQRRGVRSPVSNVTFDRRVKDIIVRRSRELGVSQARYINYLLAKQLGVSGLELEEHLPEAS
jgi:hypothetical protein